MWTRKDMSEFKTAIKNEGKEGIIKVGHGETVTVRTHTHTPEQYCKLLVLVPNMRTPSIDTLAYTRHLDVGVIVNTNLPPISCVGNHRYLSKPADTALSAPRTLTLI